MFNLNKEIEEVKLEYYIMKQAPNGVIELALSDIAELLGVSKSKAQRLIEKFLKRGILVIEKKSTSRNTKTVYRYTQNTNVNTNTDTNKDLNINENVDIYDTNNEIKGNTDDTLVSIYASKFKLNSFIEETLKLYENGIDKELFEYLLEQISNRQDIKSVEAYLITTLEDLRKNNVKNIEEFLKHTGKHKKELKKQKLAAKWGYTPSDQDMDEFDKLAEMTRRR